MPGQRKSLNVSSIKIEPPARLIVRKTQAPRSPGQQEREVAAYRLSLSPDIPAAVAVGDRAIVLLCACECQAELEPIRVRLAQEEAVPAAVSATQAGPPRKTREAAARPFAAVRDRLRAPVHRRVAGADGQRRAGRAKPVAVLPFERAALRPPGRGLEAAEDVAAQVGASRAGLCAVETADVRRRSSEEEDRRVGAAREGQEQRADERETHAGMVVGPR